jgi:hypothetical protein
MKTTNINFRIGDQLKALLSQIADAECRSLSQQVEYFLLQGLRDYVQCHPEFAADLAKIDG